MQRNIYFNSSLQGRLAYFIIGISLIALGISSYLTWYYPALSLCEFCLAVRFLLLILISLYIAFTLIPIPSKLPDILKWAVSLIGMLGSVRQVYWEHMPSLQTACSIQPPNATKTLIRWVYAGTPACHPTMLLGPLTLAGWACLLWVVLCFLTSIPLYVNYATPKK